MSFRRSNITDRPRQPGSGGQGVGYWLRAIRAEGIVLVRTRVAGRWGFEVEARDAAFFHFVTEGHAYVRRSGDKTIELLPGDLVLFPRGTTHEVSQSVRGKTMPLQHFLASHDGVFSPAPTATTIICGEFGIDRHMVLPAIQSLPLAVHLRASDDPGHAAVADILRLLRNEVETADSGNQIVVRHLLSTLFVYVLREWADAASPLAGDWFSALRSPHIARALASIHEAPANDWTLDALAEAAGLSRSAFAAQFRTSVGEPPHSYLIRWRMGIAAQLLEHTGLRLAEIAARVGYKSEFAFSRAFARGRGLSPARFRNRAKPHEVSRE
jgi:AraC-like DNA-binding protein/mannose-6-phosphate isomerase-like protein (cupin superfamily)